MESAPARLDGRVILLVEDDWLLRQSAINMLTKAGCKVREASSGEFAVMQFAKDQPIDLLIADVQLSGSVNGWEVAERARSLWPDLPVIYTSGLTPDAARQVPGSRFLAKPVTPAAILTACAAMLRAA